MLQGKCMRIVETGFPIRLTNKGNSSSVDFSSRVWMLILHLSDVNFNFCLYNESYPLKAYKSIINSKEYRSKRLNGRNRRSGKSTIQRLLQLELAKSDYYLSFDDERFWKWLLSYGI